MPLECPRCQTVVDAPRGSSPTCPSCGYGNKIVPITEQGYQSPPQAPVYRTTDSDATKALIFAIIAFCVPYIGFVMAILAIIFGTKSIENIARNGGQVGGRGMAQTAIVLGWINLALYAVGLLFLLTVYMFY